MSASNEAMKINNILLETQKLLEKKRCRVEYLELQLGNVNNDRENLHKDVRMLLAQRNIYCNSAKRL